MFKRINKKIEYLREQPEHVRMRAVSYITGISGVILVVLWITVFLPLQLFFQRDNNSEPVEQLAEQPTSTPATQIGDLNRNPNQTPRPQVVGATDEPMLPDSSRNIFGSQLPTSPSPTTSLSPTNSATKPVETLP